MTIRNHVTARIALLLTLSLTATACVDDDNGQDDAGETEGTGGTEGGDGDGDGDTAGDGDGDTTAGDGDGDTAGDGDGDGDTAGDGDGDPSSGNEVEQACAAACELTADCLGAFPGCEQLCVESHEEAEGECFDLQLAATECITTLSCEDYTALMDGEPGAPCEDELAASDACG